MDPAERFLQSLSDEERHRHGVHYTGQEAIYRHILVPSLIRPFERQLKGASTVPSLLAVWRELSLLRILDPSCGAGNFLVMAYRVLCFLQERIKERIVESSQEGVADLGSVQPVGLAQLFGIDRSEEAVELAKEVLRREVQSQGGTLKKVDCIDGNFVVGDALFVPWPQVDLIIGNPPFQSKANMQAEFGAAYVQLLRRHYPEVPGRADYCVYFFRRTHDELPQGGRAGLVGTNTIRQNDSRIGGLDYIVRTGGSIVDAVASMVWPGDAVVHVSVVNWKKGTEEGEKVLHLQQGSRPQSPFFSQRMEVISASLSPAVDVSAGRRLRANLASGGCYQGQTHGHGAFLLPKEEALALIRSHPEYAEVVHPYLIGADLLASSDAGPCRYVIDFGERTEDEARAYPDLFVRLLPVYKERLVKAEIEAMQNRALHGKARLNRHHERFRKRWWLLSYPRRELMQALQRVPRYIVCSRVTKRPIFAFVESLIHPGDALTVFPFSDEYSFGILQSSLHAAWFSARCSTLKEDPRYTSSTVFESFPWPQDPCTQVVERVKDAAANLVEVRLQGHKRGVSLRQQYQEMAEPLRLCHEALDRAVMATYGMAAHDDPLRFLLELNLLCADKEAHHQQVTGPGMPIA